MTDTVTNTGKVTGKELYYLLGSENIRKSLPLHNEKPKKLSQMTQATITKVTCCSAPPHCLPKDWVTECNSQINVSTFGPILNTQVFNKVKKKKERKKYAKYMTHTYKSPYTFESFFYESYFTYFLDKSYLNFWQKQIL